MNKNDQHLVKLPIAKLRGVRVARFYVDGLARLWVKVLERFGIGCLHSYLWYDCECEQVTSIRSLTIRSKAQACA